MYNKFFVIKNLKTKVCILILGILVILTIVILKNILISEQSIMRLPEELEIESKKLITKEVEQVKETEIKQEDNKLTIKRPDDIPEKLKDYPVIAKIEIPKIDLVTYLLNETNEKTMNVSVTKLYGPDVNTVGNLCITGHNYNKPKMFGKLKNLKHGDKIYVKDLKGVTLEYEVYDIYKIKPNELECLSQETNRRKGANINYMYKRSN